MNPTTTIARWVRMALVALRCAQRGHRPVGSALAPGLVRPLPGWDPRLVPADSPGTVSALESASARRHFASTEEAPSN